MKATVKLKMITLFLASAITMTSCSNLKSSNTIIEKEQIENSHNNLNLKTFDLAFDPVPTTKLIEGQPKVNWIKGKSIYFGNLPDQIESTIHLYLENDSNEVESSGGDIHAFLEHENIMYDLGYVSSYGIEDVNVILEDRTSDSIKEINIVGGMGATYVELKVIGYDKESKEWVNLLTMGTPQIVDLDGDGQEEIIAISIGSLPSFVDIYKWNENHFEKASITDATDNTYADIYNEDGKWIIESGKFGNGQETTPHYYRYEGGKLIEQEKGCID